MGVQHASIFESRTAAGQHDEFRPQMTRTLLRPHAPTDDTVSRLTSRPLASLPTGTAGTKGAERVELFAAWTSPLIHLISMKLPPRNPSQTPPSHPRTRDIAKPTCCGSETSTFPPCDACRVQVTRSFSFSFSLPFLLSFHGSERKRARRIIEVRWPLWRTVACPLLSERDSFAQRQMPRQTHLNRSTQRFAWLKNAVSGSGNTSRRTH